MPGQGWVETTGDPAEDKLRTLGEFLGTLYSDAPVPAKIKNATFEDLMQAHGFVPPGGRPQNPPRLTPNDLMALKDAILAKTGWTYTGLPPSACCSTWA